METVEVVIEIPQGVLNTIWAYVQSEIDNKNIISDTAYKAIANGTVLPKGHGRLIDADKLIKAIEKKSKRLKNLDTINGLCGAVALIYDAEVIIEADEDGDADG